MALGPSGKYVFSALGNREPEIRIEAKLAKQTTGTVKPSMAQISSSAEKGPMMSFLSPRPLPISGVSFRWPFFSS